MAVPVKSCHVVTTAQRAKGALEDLPFFGEELEAQPDKTRKSKAHRRREKFEGQGGKGTGEVLKPTNLCDFAIPPDIGALQKKDPTLTPWFDKVCLRWKG